MADRQSSRRFKDEIIEQESSEKEIIQIRRTPFQKALLAAREFLQQTWGPKIIYAFAGTLIALLTLFFIHDTISSSQNKTFYQIDKSLSDIRSLPDGTVKTKAILNQSEKALDLCNSFWQTKHDFVTFFVPFWKKFLFCLAAKQKHFSRHDEGLDIALGMIIVKTNSSVLQKSQEFIPMFNGIPHCFSKLGFSANCGIVFIKPLFKLFQQWF